MTTTDVVIIGAGHNGLVAACYLAKAGDRALCEAISLGIPVETKGQFSSKPSPSS